MTDAPDFPGYIPTETQVQTALDYVCRTLAAFGAAPPRRACISCAAVLAALARLCFQRFLTANCISFRVDEGVYEGNSLLPRLRVGGRRCEIRMDPADVADPRLLARGGSSALGEADVLVPYGSLAGGEFDGQDLLMFSALDAVRDPGSLPPNLRRMEQPSPLMVAQLDGAHCESGGTGAVRLSHIGARPVRCLLAGIADDGSWREEALFIPPGGSVSSAEWKKPAFLRMACPPPAAITLHWNNRQSRIVSGRWISIGLHDRRLILHGWLTRQEFRRRAHLLPAGSLNGCRRRTGGLNWGVPFRRLRPMAELADILRAA
jgi:hypothetical protein